MPLRLFALTLACLALPAAALAGPRVVSLDGCADQFVLALAPRADIAGLSWRADDGDSWLRDRAKGLPLVRTTTESVLGARPQLAVRYWGGDARLTASLEKRGVRVATIQEASDFDGVRANVRTVALALGRIPEGEALIAGMDRKLAASKDAWGGRRALYVTPGGFTAGKGTMVDAILRAAGLVSDAPDFYTPISLERVVLKTPVAFVQGFFDAFAAVNDRWGIGRHRAMRKAMAGRTAARLPGSVLGCPAWFAADGAEMLAAGRPK